MIRNNIVLCFVTPELLADISGLPMFAMNDPNLHMEQAVLRAAATRLLMQYFSKVLAFLNPCSYRIHSRISVVIDDGPARTRRSYSIGTLGTKDDGFVAHYWIRFDLWWVEVAVD
jgi:hypothetical protein